MLAQFDVIKLIESFGVTVAILIMLSFGIWRALVWLAQNVIKPMADRHIKFLDDVTEQFKRQAESITKLIENSNKTIEGMQNVGKHIEEMAKSLAEVKNLVVKTENVQILPPQKRS